MSEINIVYSHITDVYNSLIPKRIGAYIITHTYDNVHAEKYVGSTKNLFNRIYGHYDKNIIYIDLYVTDDILIAQSLERILMELINPATNKIISPLSDKDKEIMDELLRDTKIKEYTSNNVVKIGNRYLKCVNNNERRKYRKVHPFLCVRQVRKTGGSVVISLTDFAEDGDVFTLKKDGNKIILTNIKIEDSSASQV